MHLHEIHSIAKAYGVPNPDLLRSTSGAIRAIQLFQGHEPCFRVDRNPCCSEQGCEWRELCVKLVAEWQR